MMKVSQAQRLNVQKAPSPTYSIIKYETSKTYNMCRLFFQVMNIVIGRLFTTYSSYSQCSFLCRVPHMYVLPWIFYFVFFLFSSSWPTRTHIQTYMYMYMLTKTALFFVLMYWLRTVEPVL